MFVALGEHIKVPGGVDGLRSDIESRLITFIESQGGLQSLVSSGKLSQPKLLNLLGMEPTTPKLTPKELPSSSPALKKSSVKGAAKQESDQWSEIAHEIFVHSPAKAYEFAKEHVLHPGWKQLFVDLREKLSSPEALILVLFYVEFFALVLSQVQWEPSPMFSVTVPPFLNWIVPGHGKVYMPILTGLTSRKSFLYPAFYWFVYFVAIPSALGWLINLQAVSKKIQAHVCPVNMLTLSLTRLLVFYLIAHGLKLDDLLNGSPVATCHKSLTVLFDGAHLPLKVFLSTCITGLVYSLYEKK